MVVGQINSGELFLFGQDLPIYRCGIRYGVVSEMLFLVLTTRSDTQAENPVNIQVQSNMSLKTTKEQKISLKKTVGGKDFLVFMQKE